MATKKMSKMRKRKKNSMESEILLPYYIWCYNFGMVTEIQQ